MDMEWGGVRSVRSQELQELQELQGCRAGYDREQILASNLRLDQSKCSQFLQTPDSEFCQLLIHASAQFSIRSARKAFDDLKASRHLARIDLLEKQFGKSFCRAGRADDLGRQRLRCGIEENTTFLNSRQGVENCFYLFAKKLDAVDLKPVLSSAGEKEVTVFIDPGKITGWIPVLLQKPVEPDARGQGRHSSKSGTFDLEFADLTRFRLAYRFLRPM